MFVHTLYTNPPEELEEEHIQSLLSEACHEFLGLDFKSSRFKELFELMHEEIRENLEKYQFTAERSYD